MWNSSFDTLGNLGDGIYNFKNCLNVSLDIVKQHLLIQNDWTEMFASHPSDHPNEMQVLKCKNKIPP